MTKIAAVQQSIDTSSIVTVACDSTLGDMLAAESDDCVVGNKATEYWGAVDGSVWRVHMLHAAPPEDAVVVETMPDHLRSSHRAAGNWGTYPQNGAERRIMSRSDAEALLGEDPEYDNIVRDATPADAKRYELA